MCGCACAREQTVSCLEKALSPVLPNRSQGNVCGSRHPKAKSQNPRALTKSPRSGPPFYAIPHQPAQTCKNVEPYILNIASITTIIVIFIITKSVYNHYHYHQHHHHHYYYHYHDYQYTPEPPRPSICPVAGALRGRSSAAAPNSTQPRRNAGFGTIYHFMLYFYIIIPSIKP